MSLPSFPESGKTPSREEVVNQIISSIAMEELGLSHIINAEGEKLQYALGTIENIDGPEKPLTIDELLKLNDSIHKTLDGTMMNQFFLKEKLVSALSASVMQGPPGERGPQGPASIDVVEAVDSLEPGQAPYVVNDGDTEDVLLRFGIPKGEQGEQGIQGLQGIQGDPGPQGEKGEKGDAGEQGLQGIQGLQGVPGQDAVLNIEMKGQYDPSETYIKNDLVVSDEGSAFVALVDNPTGPPPTTFVSNDEWAAFVSKGAPGEQGIQGEQGIPGPQGPAFEDGQQLFTMSGTAGTGEIGYNRTLSFDSDTLEVTVGSSPSVRIENPKAHAGAIIPFASGNSIEVNTDAFSGNRSTAAILGFGTGVTLEAPADISQSINLSSVEGGNNHYAFIMPANGVITSVAMSASIYALSGYGDNVNVVTARLYYSDTPDNVFKPLEGAEATFNTTAVSTGMQYLFAVNDGLSIQVPAGVRLLYLVDTYTPDYGFYTRILAHWSGSIKIEEP